MNPYEFINFKKDDFKANCMQNSFTEAQSDEFLKLTKDYIKKIELVRHSEHLTDEIIRELIRFSDELIWIDSYWESSKYNFIVHWLTKAVWMDDTYYYAKIRLGQHSNRKTMLAVYDIPKELLSDSELYELLKGEELKRKYIIRNDKEMKSIYEICKDAFECDYRLFREGIEAANFKKLKIKRQNVVQDLTYRLSALIDTNWYTDVCKNMKWKKSICSGQGQKLEMNLIIRTLDKKLPRPKRK